MTRMLVEQIDAETFKVTRASNLTGKVTSMCVKTTMAQLEEFARGYPGRFVQQIFPELSADEREFLLNGIPPAEYDEIFKEDAK